MRKKVSMSSKRLVAILTQYRIDPELWEAWKGLVFYGKSPRRMLKSDTLTYRFYHGRQYRKCFNAIVAEISEAYYRESGIKFPPADWQPTA